MCTLCVCMYAGNLDMARKGWMKQIEIHKGIVTLVQSNQRTWSEYSYENLVAVGRKYSLGGQVDALAALVGPDAPKSTRAALRRIRVEQGCYTYCRSKKYRR